MKKLDRLFGTLFFSLALFTLWQLLSFTFSTLPFGIFSVATTVLLFRLMFKSADLYYPRLLRFSVVGYLLWLVKEAIVGAWHVCKLILSPTSSTSASFVSVEFGGKNNVYRSLLSHSITFTPGTVSVLLKGKNALVVHSLTEENKKSLLKGEMQKNLLELERKLD